MASLKGDITHRIKILDQDVVSEDRVSRAALRMKISNLQRTGEELKAISIEAISRTKIESDKETNDKRLFAARRGSHYQFGRQD